MPDPDRADDRQVGEVREHRGVAVGERALDARVAEPLPQRVIVRPLVHGLRVEADLRNEKINYKVREHSLAKVPAMLVVGKKEATERTVSIRRLGKEGQQVLPLDAALKALADEAVPPDLRSRKTAA